jgi:hypothetical protein
VSSWKYITIKGNLCKAQADVEAIQTYKNQMEYLTLCDVDMVASNLFEGAQKLNAVVLNAVTEVGEKAFAGCSNLSSVTVKEDIKLGDYAFQNTGLDQLIVDNIYDYQRNIYSEIQIGNRIFGEEVSHGKITINSGDETYNNLVPHIIFIDDTTFDFEFNGLWAYISEYSYSFCDNITSVTIDYKNNWCLFSTIGYRAFQACKNLTQVIVNSSTAYIGFQSFLGCTSLCDVQIKKLLKLEHYAFDGAGDAEKMMSLKFSGTVDDQAFLNLAAKIVKLDITNCTLGSNLFEGSNLTQLGVNLQNESSNTFSSTTFDGFDTSACSLFDVSNGNQQIYQWQGKSWNTETATWGGE